MTSVEPGVLDANVLVYAMNADHPHHKASRALIDAAHQRAATLYVTCSDKSAPGCQAPFANRCASSYFRLAARSTRTADTCPYDHRSDGSLESASGAEIFDMQIRLFL